MPFPSDTDPDTEVISLIQREVERQTTGIQLIASENFTSISILQAMGAEAASFLQAQAMNDVLALAPGQWQWNGWLNPKGRVIALFALLRTSADSFLVVLPDFPAASGTPRWWATATISI